MKLEQHIINLKLQGQNRPGGQTRRDHRRQGSNIRWNFDGLPQQETLCMSRKPPETAAEEASWLSVRWLTAFSFVHLNHKVESQPAESLCSCWQHRAPNIKYSWDHTINVPVWGLNAVNMLLFLCLRAGESGGDVFWQIDTNLWWRLSRRTAPV